LSVVASNLVDVWYGASDRPTKPTQCLDKLHQTTSPIEKHCSVCQDIINAGSALYQLPCGDCFHAGECLGEGRSIVTWMETRNTCPNCNQLIQLS